MNRVSTCIAVAAACVLMPLAWGQELYVYPAKGQSQDQQDIDQQQCYQYAKKQTGFDPMAVPTATQAAPQQQGSPVRGAARGAALGAAIGALTGDAGKGAEIGAVGGGLMGGMRRRDSMQQQQQWEQQQAATYSQNRSNYNRAYSACLTGRGYSVD